MGQRVNKIGKKKKNKRSTKREKAGAQAVRVALPNEQKNDTINESSFFGFSPKLYWRDLVRTAEATVVILVILAVVYFLTR
jgi:hypothetical protein